MRPLGKYFFSLKTDILAFTSFIPIYIIYALCFETGWVQLPPSPPFHFLLLGWLLVDGSHVYSTLLVSYTDKDIWERLKPLMIGVPIFLVVTAFAFRYSGSPELFIYFLAYLAMIHFIRQEFGWMKIATRFDPAAPAWLQHLDKTTSYAMTILPMLWFTRESQKGFWYQSGDLIAIPDGIATFALNSYFPLITLFLAANFYHSYRTKTINISKYLVFINTFFGWYMAKVYVQNIYLAIWLMIFHHGLPYYFIVFKTERVTKKISFFEKLGKLKYPVLYLLCVGIFYLFLYGHSNPYAAHLKKNEFLKALLYGISVMPQMTHFILDGFIWKQKYAIVKKVG
jgi:hypothetical protein